MRPLFDLCKLLMAALTIQISIGERVMAGPFEDALAATHQGD
jgi:hypothetical protein